MAPFRQATRRVHVHRGLFSALLIQRCCHIILWTNEHIKNAFTQMNKIRPVDLTDKTHAFATAWAARILGILHPARVTTDL